MIAPQPMKNLSILSSAIFAIACLTAHAQEASPTRATAPATSTAQVTLRVEVKNIKPEREKRQKDDNGAKKDDKAKSASVTKSLEVQITAAKTINGPLKIVTTWYGRDASTKVEAAANKEESEVTLDANKNAKLSVPPFAFTSTPASSAKGADGKTTKGEASGISYSGWVIRAYEGEKLVGETASNAPLLKKPY